MLEFNYEHKLLKSSEYTILQGKGVVCPDGVGHPGCTATLEPSANAGNGKPSGHRRANNLVTKGDDLIAVDMLPRCS
tara:strand:- start:150 stop:380 length:231 start_codon:yes stop_codon:yes gene_type:complete